MKTDLVVLMSGLGQRFIHSGITLPKPLIEVEGIPIFARSTSSITKFHSPSSISFTVLKKHVDLYSIDKVIKEHYPQANVIIFDELTSGPLESLLRAQKILNTNNPIISSDCDHEFINHNYIEFLNSTNAEKVDLAFPTFNSIKPSFSYAKVDQHNFVCEVAEKEVISNTAICSVYLISNPTELNKSWNRILDSNIPGERYLSSLARDFLLNNKKVKAFDSEQVKIYGTPESIETNERYQ